MLCGKVLAALCDARFYETYIMCWGRDYCLVTDGPTTTVQCTHARSNKQEDQAKLRYTLRTVHVLWPAVVFARPSVASKCIKRYMIIIET